MSQLSSVSLPRLCLVTEEANNYYNAVSRILSFEIKRDRCLHWTLPVAQAQNAPTAAPSALHTHHQQLQQQPQQQLPLQWQHQQPGLWPTQGNFAQSGGSLLQPQAWHLPEQVLPRTRHGHLQVHTSFESRTFRNGAAQQLSPGESGRTWSPVASDITRLTLPQPEAAPPLQKVCLSYCLSVCLVISPLCLSAFAWLDVFVSV